MSSFPRALRDTKSFQRRGGMQVFNIMDQIKLPTIPRGVASGQRTMRIPFQKLLPDVNIAIKFNYLHTLACGEFLINLISPRGNGLIAAVISSTMYGQREATGSMNL